MRFYKFLQFLLICQWIVRVPLPVGQRRCEAIEMFFIIRVIGKIVKLIRIRLQIVQLEFRRVCTSGKQLLPTRGSLY